MDQNRPSIGSNLGKQITQRQHKQKWNWIEKERVMREVIGWSKMKLLQDKRWATTLTRVTIIATVTTTTSATRTIIIIIIIT